MNTPDDRVADWLDSELPRLVRSQGVSPAPLWLPDAATHSRGLRAVILAGAMLVVGLAGGGTLLVRTVGTNSPAACANSQSKVVKAGCATPSPTSSATATASSTPSPSASASASPSPSFANHGAAVSNAAHTCPTGPDGVHGKCVSAVAKSDAGKSSSGSSSSPGD